MNSRERYTIKQHSDQPGQKFMTNDLEDAVKIATEKAKHTKKTHQIFDNKNQEIAGIVKPNGDIKREADSVLGRSQNHAVNSGTIRVDKQALKEMIQQVVAKKLGGVQETPEESVTTEWKRKDHKTMQRDKEKKDHKHHHHLHEAPKVHKITKSQLAEAVAKATKKALTEAADHGAGAYATKVDSLVSETVDSIDKLVEDGEELMRENPTHDYAIQERNHSIQARIGILKGLKNQLVKIMEDLYRKV